MIAERRFIGVSLSLKKDKDVLQHAIDHGIEDYNLLVMGNKSLASECDELKSRCEGPQAELAEARSDAEKRVAFLRQELGLLKLMTLMLHPLVRNI
jgi:hypothetical protein